MSAHQEKRKIDGDPFLCVYFCVCGLLQGTATATPPYTSQQMNKWTTQRPGGISLNEQGLLSPEIKCNSACLPYEDRRIFCITSTCNILNTRVIIKTLTHRKWLLVH